MPDEKKNLHELEAPEAKIDREQIEKKREIVKEEIERGLSPEQGEAKLEKKIGQNQENEAVFQREKAIGAGGIVAVAARQKLAKEREKKIEGILAEGLEEIYLSMPPQKQKEFKEIGEETAKEINNLLHKTKVKIGKIIKLIKKWLTLIPGVNKYFLEQEAKIKADEIMAMKNELDHT